MSNETNQYTDSDCFTAASLVHLRPRADVAAWATCTDKVYGDRTKCVVCNEFPLEGSDCTKDHYGRLAGLVRTILGLDVPEYSEEDDTAAAAAYTSYLASLEPRARMTAATEVN